MPIAPAPEYCGCCLPRRSPAPLQIYNRSGLSEIQWRIGSYATFRQAMIEALSTGPRNPADVDDPLWPGTTRAVLAGLSTRDDSDYAIMCLNLFAAVADILAFYSERFANEMFLRTARERDSLMRLVRLIGYQLDAGTAATTDLCFRVEAGSKVRISPGLKVMSVPGQDELPQIFETIGGVVADARLNDLPVFGLPRPVAPFAEGRTDFPLIARPEPLLPGDLLAIVGGNRLELHEVRQLTRQADAEYLALSEPVAISGAETVGFRILRQMRFFGHDAPDSYPHYRADPSLSPTERWVTLVEGTGYSLKLPAGLSRYPLESKFDDLRAGALLLVDLGAGKSPRYVFARVRATQEKGDTAGPLSDSVTWVELDQVTPVPGRSDLLLTGKGLPLATDRREARIFELAPQPIVPRPYVYPDVVKGATAVVRSDHLENIELLARKQRIVICEGDFRQVATIGGLLRRPATDGGVDHIEIGFTPPLGAALHRPILNANVASASHGETQAEEMLGHGDAGRDFQRFQLQKKRLTRIPTGTGIAPSSAVAVRVNGEQWREVPSLFGCRPTDHVFTLRDNDQGFTQVGFGDGRTGARTPSGASNIRAQYRTGLGAAGRVRAGQLTTLLERPPGLKSVTNPLPADGGSDPETIGNARTAAPVTVRTFGRAVSLTDFEDIARRTGLVSCASASWTWLNAERAVQLTVAGDKGAPLPPAAMHVLFDALNTARDPTRPLIIGNLGRIPIVVQARLMCQGGYGRDEVEAQARAALLKSLAFDRQPIGKSLHLSAIIAALQSAAGVRSVDVDRFHLQGAEAWTPAQLQKRGATDAPVQPHVRIFGARPWPDPSTLDPFALSSLARAPDAPALPAEQAFIEQPQDIVLTVVDFL